MTLKCSRRGIARRRIAFQHHLRAELARRCPRRRRRDRAVLGGVRRRQEDVQRAAARLDAKRGAARRSGSPRPITGASCATGRNAVGAARRIARRHPRRVRRSAWRGGSAARGATDRARDRSRSSSGSAQGRYPAADESPSANRRAPGTACSPRKNQRAALPAAHVVAAARAQRQHGADRRVQPCSNTRASRRAPSGRASLLFERTTFAGSRRSRHR